MDTKILGLTLKDWDELLSTKKASAVRKCLNYYDNNIEEEVIRWLSCPNSGRKDWKKRGFIPRFRNLVSPIVDKSGMLFNQACPTFEVYEKNSTDPSEIYSKIITTIFESSDFEELLIQLDPVLRLLKTCMVLTEWDPIEYKLIDYILHAGNSACVTDKYNKIIGLIYETTDDTYRIYTKDLIYDFVEDNEQYRITSTQINTWGIIPLTVFHDISAPRTGIYNTPGIDLINANEIYNIHLTDTEFSLRWSKLPTLYTNCRFGAGQENIEVVQEWGQALPHLTATAPAIVGGPDRAIIMDSIGVDSPFVEYKAPVFDVASADSTVLQWMQNVAQDWSVRLDVVGNGSANSGFQLVVLELPNMNLKQQRQKQYTKSLSHYYDVIKTILNKVHGVILPPDSLLYIEFPEVVLPVNRIEEENIWTIRIDNGRASIIDYLMETEGVTEQEAITIADQIQTYNTIYKPTIGLSNGTGSGSGNFNNTNHGSGTTTSTGQADQTS